MRGYSSLGILPEHEGKRQGDVQHGWDGEAWQAFLLRQLGGVDRIHDGMAHVEAGAPVILFHAFTQGHVPLPGATGTAVEKIKVLGLLGSPQDTIRKACSVQRRTSTDTR